MQSAPVKGLLNGMVDRLAAATAFRVWLASRVLCWAVGVGAILVFGAHAGVHDRFGLTTPFGSLGNTLVGPAARWDTVWYVLIADHGYVNRLTTEFYPLYPLLARAVGTPFGSSLLGGLAVSLVGFFAGLYFLYRLTALELGRDLARRATYLVGFFPTAVFFSAVYTEGLFLGLTVGAFYSARRGRWAWAGVLGGLASATRTVGIVLLVPLVLLYAYGPRDDRPPGETWGGRLRLRYRLRPDVLWLALVPVGLACWWTYLIVRFGSPLVSAEQHSTWSQTFTFPLVTVWRATLLAGTGLLRVLHGHAPDNVYQYTLFLLACAATVGALRRLPLAYGAYAAVSLLFIISFPVSGSHLAIFSRYLAPIFPLAVWLAAWSSERRWFRGVLIVSALMMVVDSARFATWHFHG